MNYGGNLIPELGRFALALAFVLAMTQCLLPLAGLMFRRAVLWRVAAPAAWLQGAVVWIALVLLAICFIQNDFSVAYVAMNSNSELPLAYRIAAVWGAHEGSLLLWVALLAVWTIAVAFATRKLPLEVSATVLAVLGAISAGFLAFMLATSDPFLRSFPAPTDGRDLNPLLQDPGLIIHPPMLYMGYVGFSVAFAFAITALISGRLDSAWVRWTRPWTTAAWVFLTLGIMLGSWWAYHELGWGGWWFWDPVENASFMPWLVGTALMHSLAATEKRGVYQSWTVLLAITAFSLSLLGTFIVRSGVLVSVHAFASDPARGVFILAFLAVVVGGSLLLYALRASMLSVSRRIELLSREGMLLLNNVFLVVAAAAVFVGTLYPLVADVMGGMKLSVGPPYFNAVFVPLTLPLALLAAVVGALRWKRNQWRDLQKPLWKPALVAILLGVALPWMAVSAIRWTTAAACVMAMWLMITAWLELWRWVKQPQRGRLPRAMAGMALAHFGLGLFVWCVTLVSSYSVEKALKLTPGVPVAMAGYEFVLSGTRERNGPNFDAVVAEVQLRANGKVITHLQPEKRFYRAQGSVMTEAGIDKGWLRDVYVALGEPLEDGAWSAHLYYRPFIRGIWFAAILMALGGVLAASDRRYRLRRMLEGGNG